jgi:ASC-1-like (ASCH) protein
MVTIGDIVEFNGYINNIYLLEYEKHFIMNNMIVGEQYEILDMDNNCFETGVTWYKILCERNSQYWVPAICFDIIDIKKKYRLI